MGGLKGRFRLKVIQGALGALLILVFGIFGWPWWDNGKGHVVRLLQQTVCLRSDHAPTTCDVTDLRLLGPDFWVQSGWLTYASGFVTVVCLAVCTAIFLLSGRSLRPVGFIGVVGSLVALISGSVFFFARPAELASFKAGGYIALAIGASIAFFASFVFFRGKEESWV